MFIISLIIATCVTGAVSWYLIIKYKTPQSRTLGQMHLFITLWTFTYLIQHVVSGIETKIIMSNLTYLFIPVVPVLWFVFAVQYAGYEKEISFVKLWPLGVIPLILQIGVWTDPVLHLFRDNIAIEEAGSIQGLVFDFGFIFWLHTFYSYLLIIAGIWLILRKVTQIPNVSIVHAFLLIGGCLIPFAANIIYLFSDSTRAGIFDLTPVFFSFSALMFAYATVKFRLITPAKIAYKYLFSSLPEGIIVLNHKDTIIDVNPAVEFFLNRRPSELFGLSVYDCEELKDADFSLWGKKYARTLILQGKDKNRIYCEMIVQKFKFDYEQEEGKLVVLRDITYRKRLEDQVAAQQKNESLEMLAGGLAHDFNNLLGVITGNISLARMDVKDPKILNLFDEVNQASKRAGDLTNRLLTFARGDRTEIEECSISPLIESSAGLFLANTGVTLDNNLPNDLWQVKADPKQLERVFQNLFVNAVQAMRKEGAISVEGSNLQLLEHDAAHSISQGRYVRIIVKDTGPGISRENLNKVFDPYFTTKDDGHGFGLSMVYSIVKRHGGMVHADSTRWGAEFTLYLPAV